MMDNERYRQRYIRYDRNLHCQSRQQLNLTLVETWIVVTDWSAALFHELTSI